MNMMLYTLSAIFFFISMIIIGVTIMKTFDNKKGMILGTGFILSQMAFYIVLIELMKTMIQITIKIG